MRVTVVVVALALVGCAKKASETSAPANAPGPKSERPAAPVVAPTPPPPTPKEEAKEPAKDEAQQARDQARAQGVLGPSAGSAFAVTGKVTIKRGDRTLDGIVKPRLDKLQACYDKALEMQESLAGELTIAVRDGKASVKATTLKDAELEKCVLDALADAQLPRKATLVLAFKRG